MVNLDCANSQLLKMPKVDGEEFTLIQYLQKKQGMKGRKEEWKKE